MATIKKTRKQVADELAFKDAHDVIRLERRLVQHGTKPSVAHKLSAAAIRGKKVY